MSKAHLKPKKRPKKIIVSTYDYHQLFTMQNEGWCVSKQWTQQTAFMLLETTWCARSKKERKKERKKTQIDLSVG